MTIIARGRTLGRLLFSDDFGGSHVRLAVLIGLSASTVLVVVRIGTAVAAAAH